MYSRLSFSSGSGPCEKPNKTDKGNSSLAHFLQSSSIPFFKFNFSLYEIVSPVLIWAILNSIAASITVPNFFLMFFLLFSSLFIMSSSLLDSTKFLFNITKSNVPALPSVSYFCENGGLSLRLYLQIVSYSCRKRAISELTFIGLAWPSSFRHS